MKWMRKGRKTSGVNRVGSGRKNSLHNEAAVNAERKRQAAIDAYMDEWMAIRKEELSCEH